MAIEGLEDLLHDELKDIYDAEKQLMKALPKLVKKALSPELKDALQAHLGETGRAYRSSGASVRTARPAAPPEEVRRNAALLSEGHEMIADAEDDATRDAVMIAAAQSGALRDCRLRDHSTWATLLGKSDVAALLEDTLEEEKEADLKLTGIAESFINEEAVEAGNDEEEKKATPPRGRAGQTARGSRVVAADRVRKR